MRLFDAEPIHRAPEQSSCVEGTADLEYIAGYLHRAVVGLAVARVVDLAARVFAAVFLKAVKHVQTEDFATAEFRIGVVGIFGRSAVFFCRL